MIKVVIITPRLQHYRLSFYHKLSEYRDKYQLTVFYGDSDKEDGKAGYTGKTNFPAKGFIERKFRILPFEVVYNEEMYMEMQRIDPDVIIFLASTGNLTYRKIISQARKRGKKIIIWTSGWDPGRAHGLLLAFKNKLVSTFYRKADYFLTYSTVANRYVESMGIDKSKISVCYNGLEIDEMVRDSEKLVSAASGLRERLNLNGYITFLFVGGLIPEKRVDLLLEAFHRLRLTYDNIKLLIIGDGPLKPVIEAKIRNAADFNIKYLGRIIQGVDPYFIASDCLVLPGAGGLALNQAMFWKKLCIVSKADGTEDDLVIENYSGYRFTENKLDSLVAAMERRINEKPEKVEEMSENAHQLILTKSNVNSMVKVFSDTIENLVAS